MKMAVDVSNCVANDCILCQAWTPRKEKPERLRRGWIKNLGAVDVNPGEITECLTMDELLNIIQPSEKANCNLIPLPVEVGPLMMHCMGYNDSNLVHQLEARAIKEGASLTMEQWLALSPYVILDPEGYISFERRGVLEGRIDYETTRFFLEIWHGYYGIKNSLRLRQRLYNLHSNVKSILPSREKRALGFLHSVVKSLGHRVVVQEDGNLLVRGDSGLHWILQPPESGAIPRVVCRETGKSYCIQPDHRNVKCPAGDYPATYALAMANDVATSHMVTTLSSGLVKELSEAKSGVGIGGLPTLNQRGEPLEGIFG